PGDRRCRVGRLAIPPVQRKSLMASSSSSLRNRAADAMPIAFAKALSSNAYQYPLSNWVGVIDSDSFLFVFIKTVYRGLATATLARSRADPDHEAVAPC